NKTARRFERKSGQLELRKRLRDGYAMRQHSVQSRTFRRGSPEPSLESSVIRTLFLLSASGHNHKKETEWEKSYYLPYSRWTVVLQTAHRKHRNGFPKPICPTGSGLKK